MLNNIFSTLGSYLSNYILIAALLGGGIWFSVILGFIQVKGFGEGMRRTFGGDKAGADGMSSFQALATAIAAQVGTGNIAGAATALAIGGPGAIFWMWIAAFLGMATIYAEAIMAQKYKQVGDDGEVTGGPVYAQRFQEPLARCWQVHSLFLLRWPLALWGMPYSPTLSQRRLTLHLDYRSGLWVSFLQCLPCSYS